MKLAAAEKSRLEDKQRMVRKYNEKNNIHHKTFYFDEWNNPFDGQMYWKYNGTYFERDRPKQDWSRLPDLFSNYLPPEIASMSLDPTQSP